MKFSKLLLFISRNKNIEGSVHQSQVVHGDRSFGLKTPRDRMIVVGGVAVIGISLAMVGLLLRVVQLQVYPDQPIDRIAHSQKSTVVLHARRGVLLDRHGRVIACSEIQKRLFADPKVIEDPGIFSEKVGYSLDYDPAQIEQAISRRPNSRYVVLDQNISPERVVQLSSQPLTGLGVEGRLVRSYPNGSIGGQLFGFVGSDGRGLEGVEKLVNNELSGEAGRMVVLRDSRRHMLWADRESYRPPASGDSVRLSIDLTIQSIVEAELSRVCREFESESGQMIVMDPVTGEILAMANYPSFDPGQLASSTPGQRRNRCVTDIFEPGSIFKPFVWSAATQLGFAHPEERIDCEDGLWVTAVGRRLHDSHPNGMQTWDGVLVTSSNIGMGKVGERMGREIMYRTVRAFGFGQEPGSGLEGASAGLVNPIRRWSGYSITSIPMGQEIGTTALQIARGYCVFANGGWLITPTIRPRERSVTERNSWVVGRVLDQRVAYHTRQVLRRVVTEGTGRKADSRMYSIFGKTGTAQIPERDKRGYAPGAYIASFIGAAPVKNPQIVVACIIHRPDRAKGYFGGIVAAPAVKNVIEQSLLYLEVAPDITAEKVDHFQVRTARNDASE